VTYALTPTLDLQVGLRYSADQTHVGGAVSIAIPLFNETFLQSENAPTTNDSEVTGKVALNWKPNNANLVYVFATRGYKAGGANPGSTQAFAPETVWDFEAGWKTTALHGHLRSQFGAYYTTYQNFQVSQFDPAEPTQTVVSNAATSSTIAGFEEQVQLQYGAFSADGSLAYTYSNIGQLPAQADSRNFTGGLVGLEEGIGTLPQCPKGVPTTFGECFDYSPFIQKIPQGPNIYSPDLTANIGVQYAFDLGSVGTLTPRVDVSYMGQQWTTFFEAPEDNLKDRTLVNAQLTLQHADWTVQAYATNIFDKVYVSGFSVSFGNNYFLLPPRQFGVRVTRRF
jgi:iron complex outermembrane receptor protein